jgi:hypothetical protein
MCAASDEHMLPTAMEHLYFELYPITNCCSELLVKTFPVSQAQTQQPVVNPTKYAESAHIAAFAEEQRVVAGNMLSG